MNVAATTTWILADNENPLIPNIDELVVGTIAFAIVFGLLAKALLPRINKTLSERTDAIEGGIERAREAEAEAKDTLEQYRSQLAEARHEAARLREEAREQGAAILAEMREQAQAESRRLTAAAHQQIEADRQQAVNQLRVQVGALATDLASRIVGESLEDDARQRRVIDRFLDDLEREADGSGGNGTATASAREPAAEPGDQGAHADGDGSGPLDKVRAAAAAVAEAIPAVKKGTTGRKRAPRAAGNKPSEQTE